MYEIFPCMVFRNSAGELDWTLPSDFVLHYSSLDRELLIEGVFVRHYNAQPSFVVANADVFVAGISRTLSESSSASMQVQDIQDIMQALTNVLAANPSMAESPALASAAPSLCMLLDRRFVHVVCLGWLGGRNGWIMF